MRRASEVLHQHIGVGVPHRVGDAFLVLQLQGVGGPPRGPVQFAAGRQEQLGRAGEVVERILQRRSHVGAIDLQRPTDHVVVA